MKQKKFISKTMLLIAVMVVGVTSAWADTYKLTIQASIFNGTSYAANNNEKTSYAVCTTDATKTFEVKWTSNQMMRQGETIQWQKNSAYIYNSTNLGTIIEVKITGNDISYLTTYYGTSSNPSSNTTVGGGFFKIMNGDYTTTTSKIEVTFSPYDLTAISNNESYGTVSFSGNKITANPESGYRISKTNPYTVTSGTATVEQNNNVFTVTADTDCTVQINFEEIPSHTATFYYNGAVYAIKDTFEDEEVEFPEDPCNIGNKVFMGWTTSVILGTTNEAPSFVSNYTMQTEAVNYYAVYATFTQGDYTTVTDVLNRATTGITGTTYSSWGNKKATSEAVYAGNSAGGNGCIQIRTDYNNSGVISTASGGTIKKIVVVWGSSTLSGRTLDIYGSNTAFTSPSNLYNSSKCGTKIGSIVNGTSTELEVSGNYAYIGLRSKDGAMYLFSVSITWSNGTPDAYTDYCTTLAEPITIGSTGYATYSGSSALNFANSDVTAFTVKYENGSAKLTAVEQVPAGAGVVLRANQGEYNINLLASADELSNNDLQVSDGTKTGNGTYFCLANGNNGVGFYRVGDGVTIPAGKCYLEVPSSSRQFIGFDDNTTSIDNATEEAIVRNGYFDLQGRQVAQPTKGLYIVNGKKVIIK